jgi:hypothetical protein
MLNAEDPSLRDTATTAWKLVLMTRQEATDLLVFRTSKNETVDLKTEGFDLLFQMDVKRFRMWLQLNRSAVDLAIEGGALRIAQEWVGEDVRAKEEALRALKARRDTRARLAARERRALASKRGEFLAEVGRQAELIAGSQSEHATLRKRDDQDRRRYVVALWNATRWRLATTERGVWTEDAYTIHRKWRLDSTEGPFRMRRKFERDYHFFERYPFIPPDVEGAPYDATKSRLPTSHDSKDWYAQFGDALRQ